MRASALVLTAAMAVLAGCPEPAKQPEPPPPAPEVVGFSASPAVLKAGENTTLTWETKNATSVSIVQAGVGLLSGADKMSGSVEVGVQDDALFVLVAKNDRGVEASAAVSVQVDEPAKEVLFIATPAELDAGASTTLAWSAIGARDVSLATSTGEAVDVGTQTTVGAVTVTPAQSTTYVLTVDGVEHTRAVLVRPGIGAFTATPASAKPGEDISLSWQSSGATEVEVALAGVGVVHTETDAAKVADGSFTFAVPAGVHPAAALTFTLIARDATANLSNHRDLTVYMTGAPKVRDWTVPAYVPMTGTFDVSWRTTGADRLQILRDDVVVLDTQLLPQVDQGTASFSNPAAITRFTLRAINSRGGVDEVEKTVEPLAAPTITTFTATPTAVANGGDPVTVTWNVPNARRLKVVAEGIGTLADLTGPQAETGTVVTYPNKNTVIQLDADNTVGDEVTQSIPVTVTSPATLVFNPATAPIGAPLTITVPSVATATEIELFNVIKNAGTASFVDISTTGTNMNYSGADFLVDDFTLSPAFNTVLFGNPVSVTKVSLSVNGWFTFGSSSISEDVPQQLPSSVMNPYAIAPLFGDFYNDGNTEIFYQVDTVGTEQRLIIQWDRIEYEPIDGSEVTFQAQVYSSGKVVFAYQSVQAAAGGPVSIGMQNDTKTVALTAPAVLPADGDTYTLLPNSAALGRTALPATTTLVAPEFYARVYMGSSGFIDIEQIYPVMPANQIRITEVNVSPATGVTDGQWFEVENTTAQPFDLSGWNLGFGATTHAIAAGTIIPANGRMVFAQSANAGDGVNVGYTYGNTHSIPAGGSVAVLVGTTPYATMALPQATLPAGRTWQVGPIAAGMTAAAGATELDCLASNLASYGTNGQKGTPGAANTACPNYSYAGAITANFESIAATGTALTFSDLDDAIATINLTTPVVVDGVSFSSLIVSTNGYISLLPMTCDTYCWSGNKLVPDPAPTDSALPPYGFIAPYWDDNDLSAHGGVYWERKSNYTIVSWENVHHYTSTSDDQSTDSLNFQVKFFDTGDVEFHFGTMTGEDGSRATTWFEHPSSKAAFIVNVESATAPGITSNTAFRFAAQ